LGCAAPWIGDGFGKRLNLGQHEKFQGDAQTLSYFPQQRHYDLPRRFFRGK
jgi:hypothetical protein